MVRFPLPRKKKEKRGERRKKHGARGMSCHPGIDR